MESATQENDDIVETTPCGHCGRLMTVVELKGVKGNDGNSADNFFKNEFLQMTLQQLNS